MLGTAGGQGTPPPTSGGHPALPCPPQLQPFSLQPHISVGRLGGGRKRAPTRSQAESERACTTTRRRRMHGPPASSTGQARAEGAQVSHTHSRVPVSRGRGREKACLVRRCSARRGEGGGLAGAGGPVLLSIVLVLHVGDVHDGHQPALRSSPAPQPVGVRLARHAQDVPLLEAQLPGLRGDVVAKGLHLTGEGEQRAVRALAGGAWGEPHPPTELGGASPGNPAKRLHSLTGLGGFAQSLAAAQQGICRAGEGARGRSGWGIFPKRNSRGVPSLKKRRPRGDTVEV